MRFDELDLEDEILDGLEDMNFHEMTPVQEHTIPVILEGRDIIGCAQTGTGKTAAYTLPLLNKLLIEGNPDNVVKSLIIVPTRELAQQIDQQFQGFSYYAPLSTTVVYGGGDGKGWDIQKNGMLNGADVVIACLGESADMSGEGYCRSELGLPGVQQELLKELKKTGKPVVLLLSNGRPLTLAWEKENIETIVETWFLGTEAGNAVADVLFGKYNPSGKLVMSFPYNVGQIPVYYNHKHTGRPFEPNQRYVMHYIDAPVDALYPFGYGLSYTTFEYGVPTLSSDRMADDGRITATVKVANTGDYDGEEVVQLYIRDIKAQITRPVKELKGFRKIFLKKGESADVTFDITRSELEYVLADGSVVSDPGEFELFIGGSSADLRPVRFTVLQ